MISRQRVEHRCVTVRNDLLRESIIYARLCTPIYMCDCFLFIVGRTTWARHIVGAESSWTDRQTRVTVMSLLDGIPRLDVSLDGDQLQAESQKVLATLRPAWNLNSIRYMVSSKFSTPLPGQEIRGIQPMRFKCWTSVEDGGPTLKRHWMNAPFFAGITQQPTWV